MVSFLAGLSSFAPNFMDSFQKGEDSAYKRKKEKREDAIYSDEELGKSALMKALMPQQPQMGPGQPSQPMQQPAPQQPQAMPMSAGGVNAGGMQSVIAQAAQKYGIPPEVGIAMGKQESGLNPNAPHGGLMQILDSTARQPGYGMQGVDPAALRDPRANADFGMHYLAARNPNVNWSDPAQRAKALQSYNGGGDPNYVSHVTGRMGGGGDPQGQPPQSAQGGGGDWRQFAAKIMTSNPNLTPGALLYALHAAQPFMNADSRAQIQQLGLEMREKNIESRERIAGAATTERGREADQKAGIEEKKLTAKAEQFKTHQAAIQQRFEDRYMQAEEKIANAKTKEAKAAVLTELRQAEQDRRAAMANRVKAAAAGMDTKELKALEEEERQNKQDAEQRIDALTKQARGDAPARAALGGREAATQAAPKGKPLDDTVKRQMQEAIQAGASKEAIAAKARELGYDISGF